MDSKLLDRQVALDCRVQISQFEGPLDLLLHLIKTHEFDIKTLSISQITKQYLVYLDFMRELNLDMASEYLVMAATLTYLKSQVILPQELKEGETGPDPRAQLIRKLLELKCYKELSASLESRPRLGRDVFLSRNTGIEEIQDGIEPEVALTNPFQLVESYKDLIKRRRGVVHKVFEDAIPVKDCLRQIVERLRSADEFEFTSLLPNPSKPGHIISNFLATLELAKMQISGFRQEETFGPIKIYRRQNLNEMTNYEKLTLSWN
jgi:segregation and condensation protein A